MHELATILHAMSDLATRGDECVLATVTAVEGSTYRRPGARLLVTADGRRLGCVSGGCLERDVARRGWALSPGGPGVVLTYDSRGDDDPDWGLGLGCGGAIQVLVERLAPAATAWLSPLRERVERRVPCVLSTVFSAKSAGALDAAAQSCGARLLIDAGGAGFIDPRLAGDGRLLSAARSALDAGGARVDARAGAPASALIFHEFIAPPLSLVLFGAGHDAAPLVAQAKALGWRVTIVDRRADYANRRNFPAADEVVACPLDRLDPRVELTSETFAVVMTHHFRDDQRALKSLLDSPIRYIGLLGPSHRRDRVLADSLPLRPGDAARLFAPVGLDVAAENPAEIAVAIVAEILAVRAGRAGGLLRACDGAIHRTGDEPGIFARGATVSNACEASASPCTEKSA